MKAPLKLEAPWQEVKELIKEVNPDLTDDDLMYEPGQEHIMLLKLAKKMNRSVEHIKSWIESISYNEGKAS